MIIFRFWLEQLFNCAFELALFANIFNPTMINLLFDDYKAISFQFHIQKACIDTSNAKFENFLKLGLNRFTIYNNFVVTLEVISEQQTNILFNIITNEGKKLPRISFCYCDSSRLYDLIIQVIFKNGTLCLHRPSPYFGQPNRQNSSILLYLYCVSRICYK